MSRYYWVNKNPSKYEFEQQKGCLWLPIYKGKGPWQHSENLVPGDIVFIYVSQQIVASGVVKSYPVESDIPDIILYKDQKTAQQWKKVELTWKNLKRIMNRKDIENSDELVRLLDDQRNELTYSPYNASKRKIGWQTLFPLSQEAGKFILTKLGGFGQSIQSANDQMQGYEDRRQRKLSEVIERPGQTQFRDQLFKTYGQCVITACKVPEALEAAHIEPYRGPESDQISNGLLLRRDIHRLFDLGLLWINPDFTIAIASRPDLISSYGEFQGQAMHSPANRHAHPDRNKLDAHRSWSIDKSTTGVEMKDA